MLLLTNIHFAIFQPHTGSDRMSQSRLPMKRLSGENTVRQNRNNQTPEAERERERDLTEKEIQCVALIWECKHKKMSAISHF